MNKFILQIVENLSITIERVYLRIEDPYPFALGIILPRVTVRSADRNWCMLDDGYKNDNPEIAYKSVRIEDFAIFMERDATEVSIDEMIELDKIRLHPDFI
jgi:hypothetical protein